MTNMERKAAEQRRAAERRRKAAQRRKVAEQSSAHRQPSLSERRWTEQITERRQTAPSAPPQRRVPDPPTVVPIRDVRVQEYPGLRTIAFIYRVASWVFMLVVGVPLGVAAVVCYMDDSLRASAFFLASFCVATVAAFVIRGLGEFFLAMRDIARNTERSYKLAQA